VSVDENIKVDVTAGPIQVMLPIATGDTMVNDIIKISHTAGNITSNNITIIAHTGGTATILGGSITINTVGGVAFVEFADNNRWINVTEPNVNFANTDLILNNNRTHDLNGFDLVIGEGTSQTIGMFNGFVTQVTYGNSIWEIANNYQNFSVSGISSLDMLMSEMVVNNGGINYNFRVEGDTDQNLLFTNAFTDRIGIGTNTPSEKLDVSGKTKTINFQMTSGSTAGYVLTSDSSGNASWTPQSGITGNTDTYVTGVTYSSNTLTVSQNNGQSPINTVIGLNIKSDTVSAGSFTGTPLTYTVTFVIPYPSTNHTINITGSDNRVFTYESKTINGFVINTNANTALTGNVDWQTISIGES